MLFFVDVKDAHTHMLNIESLPWPLCSLACCKWTAAPSDWSRVDHMAHSIGHRCVSVDHKEIVMVCPQDVHVYFEL